MLRQRSLTCAAVCAGVVVAILPACGGGSKGGENIGHGSARTGAGPATHEVCEPMVRDAVPVTVGLPLAGEPVSDLRGDTFSCTYAFAGGSLNLSVRDLHTIPHAHADFRDMRAREAVGDALSGLAEGGFTTADGSVVAMKDAMVLTVDVAALPPTQADRSGIAVDLAATVLRCWTADK